MGLGDAKLFAVIGFWFGWISIPFVIFLSSIIALLSVLPDLLRSSKKLSSQIPFGSFIILGTIFYLVFHTYLLSIKPWKFLQGYSTLTHLKDVKK